MSLCSTASGKVGSKRSKVTSSACLEHRYGLVSNRAVPTAYSCFHIKLINCNVSSLLSQIELMPGAVLPCAKSVPPAMRVDCVINLP